MAAGLDELLDFLLAEIALCGTQGAGSEDFVRFVQTYFGNKDAPQEVARPLLEKVWKWVTNHPDIRITQAGQICHHSLSQFEDAEKETANRAAGTVRNAPEVSGPGSHEHFQVSNTMQSLRKSLRDQLSEEHSATIIKPSLQPSAGPEQNAEVDEQEEAAQSWRAKLLSRPNDIEATAFDDSSLEGNAPRLYTSQNRIWQALTGHEIDLKRVPSMEFILLSIIAAHGETGITQPDLFRLSNQDKRSVPKRTDELARKGYIFKNPVQAGKIRTSMCVHSKFVSKSHYLTSADVDDVFQPKQFVPTGFAHLIYDKLKDAGIVPTREIRTRLNVPIHTWNKRAVQGALIRLHQSGMITRSRVRKNKTEDDWIMCIRILREPRVEDFENLGFRRQPAVENTAEELLQDDADGDTLMKDLEVDMLDDNDNDTEKNGAHDDQRVPPQWVPDRLLSNFLFDATLLGLESGTDGIDLRDRIIGLFWRRPLESYLTRVTDDWARTQPPHLRHLAIIRDTRTTEEKRFIHYVYRTYRNFQKAVDAGEVSWEGVTNSSSVTTVGVGSKKQSKGKVPEASNVLDNWGFPQVDTKHFVGASGAASVSDVRAAISTIRKHGPRWDAAIINELGHRKADLSSPGMPYSKKRKSLEDLTIHDHDDVEETSDAITSPKPSRKGKPKSDTASNLHLTLDQRIALGLKITGRLSKSAAMQILNHRKKTGDPESLPASIVEEPVIRKNKIAPLMTKEERIAANLPPRGRLGIDIENKLREERGLPVIVEKGKKRYTKQETPIMTREQRIKFGLKPHGRLHQDFVEALRTERDNGVSLEDSPTVKAYLQSLGKEMPSSTENDEPQREEAKDVSASETDQADHPAAAITVTVNDTDDDDPVVSPSHKRKASGAAAKSRLSKRSRAESIAATSNEVTSSYITGSPQSAKINNVAPEAVHEGPPPHSNPIDSTALNEQQDGPIARLTQVRKPVKRSKLSIAPQGIKLGDNTSPRSAPGLYVYPEAKRNIGRGRPKSAFVALFRLPQLQNLHWFNDASADVGDPSSMEKAGPITTEVQQEHMPTTLDPVAAHPIESASSNPALNELGTSGLAETTQSTVAHRETSNLDVAGTTIGEIPGPIFPEPGSRHQGDVEDGILTESAGLDGINAVDESESSQQMLSHQQTESTQQLSSSTRVESATRAESLPQRAPMMSSIRDKLPSEIAQPSPRPFSSLSLLDGATRTDQSPYHSPYAQSPRSDFAPPDGTADSLDIGAISRTTDGMLPTPEDSATLPEGIVATVALAQGKSSFRSRLNGRASGLSGSHVQFRQAIILEIIERCDGIFPLHGEIWRPFSALWDEQHGHKKMRKPINSTVFETLREMIDDPAFGLKRMTFLAKANNAAGAKKKMMVARKDIPPNDRRVLQLAHDMANNAVEKSNQFFPEQIRHLFDFQTLYTPQQIAPKDESFTLDQFYPGLQETIKQSKIRRRQEKAAKRKSEKAAAKLQNDGVERARPRKQTQSTIAPREKRARLASLNDKNKRYRRAVQQMPPVAEVESLQEDHMRLPSPIPSDSSEDIPLMTLRRSSPNATHQSNAIDLIDWSEETVDRSGRRNQLQLSKLRSDGVPLTHPIVEFQAMTGTFGTYFGDAHACAGQRSRTSRPITSRKRVRIDDSTAQRPVKKARIVPARRHKQKLDSEFIDSSTEDSDETSSEEEAESIQTKKKPRKIKSTPRKRSSNKTLPLPTLLERLVGLTGDPNDSIYTDPKQRSKPGRVRTWSEKKKIQHNRMCKERQYQEQFDPVDNFKRLCCALSLAASMSGDADTVAWHIVEKVYAHDKFFDMARTQQLWNWMQFNMATELTELTSNFQDVFLDAYEECRIPEIDNPDTYDWAGVVRWIMRTCSQPDLSLPVYRAALNKFTVDESNYVVLDRPSWYGKRLADTVRIHTQLQYSFVSPLHKPRASTRASEDKILKARAWTRSNIATPQAVYDANKAHDKLRNLGEDVLTRVVADYVENEQLKMRKLKRQLPGRNYTFTKRFAQSYRRLFELSDFMHAVQLKKQLDLAFSHEDPSKRFRDISQSEEDGSIMAIMSLVSDGMVTLVPQLPKVDNEFGAPLPRLSKWGFCEGDYIHRAIDRNRLFWDLHIVPTENYEFGNPLEPTLTGANGHERLSWAALPDPPLPGKEGDDALLPIWSSIDGQHVSWPWWYRILNLVVQPLHLQPGITATDIHAHCPEHVTEIFEVQLVLDWLLRVGAVMKVGSDGYQTTPCFWAAFGDNLRDTEDDWFGEHVKRKTKTTTRQQWRDEYNLRFSSLRNGTVEGATATGDNGPADGDNGGMTQQILSNTKAQYRVLQQTLPDPELEVQKTRVTQDPPATAAAEAVIDVENEGSAAPKMHLAASGHEDFHAQIVDDAGDVEMDASGDEDDAIGDVDDEMV